MEIAVAFCVGVIGEGGLARLSDVVEEGGGGLWYSLT